MGVGDVDAGHAGSAVLTGPALCGLSAYRPSPERALQSRMLDSRRMTALKLRFPTPEEPELPLDIGVHGVGRVRGTLAPVGEDTTPCVRFCVDRRGVWLTVGDGVQGVHVNGRQVRRMAMLRGGDAVFVDGHELRLVSARPVPERVPADVLDQAGTEGADPRIVLRGVGGRYHGRSFTLETPLLVGRHADADIRIDEPGFPERHARLERIGHMVLLTDLGNSEGSLVNGDLMRNAALQSGDQVVFEAHHRFVVEAPSRPVCDDEPFKQEILPVGLDDADERAQGLPLPWLLLAALVLAGLIAALLLYGTT